MWFGNLARDVLRAGDLEVECGMAGQRERVDHRIASLSAWRKDDLAAGWIGVAKGSELGEMVG